MALQLRESEIARGPGPAPVRIALAVVACLYFFALLKRPGPKYMPLSYFTECTKLFPEADTISLEYHLDAWSCDAKKWVPMDPRPYFPIEADDKESRFQRLGYFYADRGTKEERRTVLYALDQYIVDRHEAVDDGVGGKIGGIRLMKLRRPLPEVGDPVPRYVYEPLAEVPAEIGQELFETPGRMRKDHCSGSGSGSGSDEQVSRPDEEPAP